MTIAQIKVLVVVALLGRTDILDQEGSKILRVIALLTIEEPAMVVMGKKRTATQKTDAKPRSAGTAVTYRAYQGR